MLHKRHITATLATTAWLLLTPLLLPGAVVAPEPAPAESPPPLPPEFQAELDALMLPRWEHSTLLRASAGWRDNLLLSSFAPIERPFGRAEIEAVLWRPMRERWEFVSFLSGDVLRFVSPPPETHGEQQWAASAEGRWQPARPVRFGLKGVGYFNDMVIDLSETEAQRVVAPVRVHGGQMNATVRLSLPAGLILEPAVQVRRNVYRDYAGDYDQQRGGGRIEWRRKETLVLSATWIEDRRRYDDRPQYTAGGRALEGTQLRFRQRTGEVKARVMWGSKNRWDVAVTAGGLENRDLASGYFDYDQRRGRVEISWRRAAWRLALDAEEKLVDYRVQTVGAGLSPPPRTSTDFEVTLRAERELNEGWMLFVQQHAERSRSNEPGFSYRANTMLAGAQRSF